MSQRLDGKRVALLVADGFEQIELTEPKQALEQAGARAEIVSPAGDQVKGWQHTDWGDVFDVDAALDSASASDYDALVLPGGVMSPDRLRSNKQAVAFVRDFFNQNKPVAAICHGGWTLIEADVVRGRRMTSYPSIQTDLKNAGANWVDEEVVVDDNLVTSRSPDDLPAFNAHMVEKIASG
ncbi:MAG: type 1 glutamine amidotransferase domain-containing protein [Halothiobacillaceae bacterium]